MLSSRTQARLAFAAQARQVSDHARTLVPVQQRERHGGDCDELIDAAVSLRGDVEELLALAVTVARLSAQTWQQIGQQLAPPMTRQSAHERYREHVRWTRDGIQFPTRQPQAGGLAWSECPDGLEDPEATMRALDAWLSRHHDTGDPRTHTVTDGLNALHERHAILDGISQITTLATAVMNPEQLPNGVTPHAAHLALQRAKVDTYTRISHAPNQTPSARRQAGQAAADARDQLAVLAAEGLDDTEST